MVQEVADSPVFGAWQHVHEGLAGILDYLHIV
jgi:hypothetical protein